MDEKNFTFEFDKSKKVMEELLYTAEPIKSYNTLIVLIGVLIGLVVFLFLVETKKIKSITGTYRQIATLLSGLMTLIMFATTLFTAWNLYTIQPVKLYETYMESFHGKTPYKQIERFLQQFVSIDNKDEWGDHSDVRLFARWARKRTMTDISMSDALINAHEDTLKDTDFIDPERDLKEIIIRYSPTGSASAMKSRKKSIEFLEDQIVYFAKTYVDISK